MDSNHWQQLTWVAWFVVLFSNVFSFVTLLSGFVGCYFSMIFLSHFVFAFWFWCVSLILVLQSVCYVTVDMNEWMIHVNGRMVLTLFWYFEVYWLWHWRWTATIKIHLAYCIISFVTICCVFCLNFFDAFFANNMDIIFKLILCQ